MLPKLIIHNSISLDGSLTNFEVNMGLHYQLASSFKADLHLVGSNTVKTGIDIFLEKIPKETREDFKKPAKKGIFWAIPDSTGKLNGLVHIIRQSEYCRDAIIFISENTRADYIKYLETRNYDHYIAGKDKCDLKKVLNILQSKYGAKTILTDAGSILSNLLIEQGLVSEISMLVHPVINGRNSYNMFCHIPDNLSLRLVKKELIDNQYLWLTYTTAK